MVFQDLSDHNSDIWNMYWIYWPVDQGLQLSRSAAREEVSRAALLVLYAARRMEL